MKKDDAIRAVQLLLEWLYSRSTDASGRLPANDRDELRLRLQSLLARMD